MFSSGVTNTSIAIYEMLTALGHTVDLVNMNTTPWWDDCKGLQSSFRVVPISDASGYDFLFEIDRLFLLEKDRKRIAAKSVWILRHTFLVQEMEWCLYPTVSTPKREFEGLHEVWMFDTLAAEEGALQAVELLTRCPVRVIPYLWTPSIAATHTKEIGSPSWIATTISELRSLEEKAAPPPPKWKFHVTETNMSNTSSTVIPLVVLREAKRQGIPIGEWKIHNSQALLNSRFFKENILAHCSDLDVSGACVGRQRCPEWTLQPMSCVLSHLRFTSLRPSLLDVVWSGVPLIHNSRPLKDIGSGLERLFYADNNIGEACHAIRQMEHDFVTMGGIFSPTALETIRGEIESRFSPSSITSRATWNGLIGSNTLPIVMNPAAAHVAPVAPVTPVAPVASTKVFRVGFADMWENFNPAYNFFTLMLGAAGATLNPRVEVVGGPATAEDAVVIFGPFGETWKALPVEQPKIHFSGEFTAPIEGPGVKLNLGFHHFDMLADDYLRFPLWILEVDWFGAAADQIVNPKPIPLEACTQVRAADLPRKKKFCAFVVSNPSNSVRNTAFQWLSEYKNVDSAGAVMNTMGPALFAGAGGGGGELKKFEFLKDYKFCLTYENTAGRGYTTEKFLHAKAAGCIPIYWGDPMVERDFCLGGAIDARKVKTKEELIELVRAVDESDSEWLKRYSVPALDDYRVAWCRRTMAECSRRIFKLGGFDTENLPRMLFGAAAAATATATEQRGTIETPLMVTCVNRKFLPSLQQWLISIGAQSKAMPGLTARVYFFSDIPADTLESLKEKFKFATFVPLPDSAAPEGAFADFWKPQHYGWKLWIYNQLSKEAELAGRMVLYMDAGAFLCRWPVAWLKKAQEKGVCFLEDPREENRRWCSPEFCAALKVTEAELAAQQTLGGLVAFRCGAAGVAPLFEGALALAYRREILVGDKWAGQGADGRPFGHRHDQSILSILGRRAGVATEPLDTVYCDKSLRKTFNSGKCIYVHRGQFAVHVPFSEGIDDAYVINLERRADRLEKLWTNSPELKGRVERWPAVDGRSLKMTPAIAGFLKPNDFMWKKAISGCALSHLGLWWKLATETHDIESYLILEDDVKFKEGWEKTWRQAVVADAVPEDCDIIYLGGVLPPNRSGWNETCKERVNDFFCRVKENTMWGQDKPNRYFHFCAYSYILSKKGAQKVIDIIRTANGCWTSADHILCNPVDILKAYVMDPLVAGCYQDDDPKYATSQFNDFSRIDGFDSDLWNNDERFSDEEKAMAVAGAELDFKAILKDTTVAPAAAAPAAVPAATLSAPKCGGKPVVILPRQFLCMDRHALKLGQLHEADWLMALFGSPTVFSIDAVGPDSPPLTGAAPPVFILQKPHIQAATTLLTRWSAAGAKFLILHMSDETLDDSLDIYELPGCEKVLRFYVRGDLPCPEKVTTIPLGYHWTLREGSKNPLNLTPRLPFRELVWSFHGTNWRGRKEALKPLIDLSGAHLANFYDQWLGSEALGKEQYIATLLNSVFAPCPEGVNGETFRFYEALECGCVPLIVRTESNSAWVDWTQEHLQIVDLPSWSAAASFMEHLLANKEKLEKYREVLLGSWIRWRGRLLDEGVDWLKA